MKEETRNKKNVLIFMSIGILIAIIFPMISMTYDTVGPSYKFNNEIHSHMINAYYANSPELMIQQLALCEQGMRNLDLDESLYGSYLPWLQTPEIKMDYQYNHLNAIIDRTKSVIEWRNETYTQNGTAPETLGDVYNTKMANLRSFLIEGGWSDWISYQAFYVHDYLWLKIYWDFIEPILCLIGVVLIIFGIYNLGVNKEWWDSLQ
jgi:hypothetical protein